MIDASFSHGNLSGVVTMQPRSRQLPSADNNQRWPLAADGAQYGGAEGRGDFSVRCGGGATRGGGRLYFFIVGRGRGGQSGIFL